MEAKIAVVMPVYNAERFIRRGIDSLLKQSYKDIKIICVNDASPDNCAEILSDYATQDDRIVVINHEENKGAGAARNTGLDYIYRNLPDVEYISFVDADDRIEPNTYEKAYSEAKKCDADILNWNFLPSTYWQYKTEATADVLDYDGNCLEAIFEHNEFYTFVVCWSKLYKKELLENIRFSGRQFFEDGSNYEFKAPKRGRVTELIVKQEYRSKGIGQQLIDKIEKHFKSVGCKSIIIEVFAYNENAKKFYYKNNYHDRCLDVIKKI